jgi:hypothetical protein
MNTLLHLSSTYLIIEPIPNFYQQHHVMLKNRLYLYEKKKKESPSVLGLGTHDSQASSILSERRYFTAKK